MALALAVIAVVGIAHAVRPPFLFSTALPSEAAASGIRVYFSVARFAGFVIPVVVLAAVLAVGGLAIVRHRVGRTRPATRLAGWAGRLAAALMVAVGLVTMVALVRSMVHHADAWALAVVAGLAVGSLAVLAVRTLRTSTFHLGRWPALGLVVAGVVVVLVPYGAAGPGGQSASFDTGFRGFARAPDPHLAEPVQVACGDATHCAVAGMVDGLWSQAGPRWGVAGSADAAVSWRATWLPSSGEDLIGTLSCRQATCWALVVDVGLGSRPGILTADIGSHSPPHVAVTPAAPIPVPTGSRFILGASTCDSSVHCVNISPVSAPGRPYADSSLQASVTTDGGATWRSTVVPLPAGVSAEIAGPARTGPQCDPQGTCVLVFGTIPSPCTGACPQTVEVLRSVDAGEHWQLSPLVALRSTVVSVVDPSCQALPVCTVTVEDADGASFYARSDDAGQTWSLPQPTGGPATVKCSAALCMRSLDVRGDGFELAASFDRGATWEPAPTGVVANAAIASMGCSADGPCLVAYATVGGSSVSVVAVSADRKWSISRLPDAVRS